MRTFQPSRQEKMATCTGHLVSQMDQMWGYWLGVRGEKRERRRQGGRLAQADEWGWLQWNKTVWMALFHSPPVGDVGRKWNRRSGAHECVLHECVLNMWNLRYIEDVPGKMSSRQLDTGAWNSRSSRQENQLLSCLCFSRDCNGGYEWNRIGKQFRAEASLGSYWDRLYHFMTTQWKINLWRTQKELASSTFNS